MERKEAIEVIKNNWPDSSFTMLCEALETLIPELKENEDEKIRKTLIRLFTRDNAEQYCGITRKQIIAWLEKQGEQKHAWNEEDEKMFKSIIECIDGTGLLDSDQINWFKSLKSR